MTEPSEEPRPGDASAWPGPAGPGYWNDVPWPAPPKPPRRPGRAAAVFAVVFLAVGVLGAPLGLLWAAAAPKVPVRMGEDGALLVETQPEGFAAADGWFTLLGLGFGALAAIVVWLVVRRRRGPLSLFAVTLGAVAAGLLAWWLGRRIGIAEYERLLESAPVGTVFGKPADLRAADAELWYGFLPVVRGDALVPALGAAVAYTLLAGWSRYPSLRPEPPAGDPVTGAVGNPPGHEAGDPPGEGGGDTRGEPADTVRDHPRGAAGSTAHDHADARPDSTPS